MPETDPVIDLTVSFILADHRSLSNQVIDLLDAEDSLYSGTGRLNDSVPPSGTPSVKNVEPTKTPTAAGIAKELSLCEPRKIDAESPKSAKKVKFGECAICLEEFGDNPSCLKCIKLYLRYKGKCPTCRQSLEGSNAYHPLYIR